MNVQVQMQTQFSHTEAKESKEHLEEKAPWPIRAHDIIVPYA
jgi:hypothetical protein